MGHLKDELAIKKNYGNKVSFNKEDGVWRFRDDVSGSWTRYTTVLDKGGNPRNGWGSSGEVIGGGVDMHFVANNDVKVFMFVKPIKIKK
jgi:hypothetical protein